MRLQIDLNPEIKAAAEAQAVFLGYSSLAAMLRVVAVGLARDYPVTVRVNPPIETAAKAAIPESTKLPDPAQFKHWPPHIENHLIY